MAHPLIVEATALGVAVTARDGALRVAPASRLPPELRARLVAAKPAVLAALATNDAGGPGATSSTPTADPARGRRLLARLRWTGRYIGLSTDGTLVVRPRLGTADPFGREVVAHPDDIAAVLAAETAGGAA